MLYLITPKSHVGGDESNEYNGLTDRQWCIENGIPVSTFYYHVRALRKKACEVPEAVDAAAQKQEVVQIPLWEREQHSDTVALHTPSICLEMQGIRIEIHEQAGADVIRNTLLALRQLFPTAIPCFFSAADAVTGSKRFILKKMDSVSIINV